MWYGENTPSFAWPPDNKFQSHHHIVTRSHLYKVCGIQTHTPYTCDSKHFLIGGKSNFELRGCYGTISSILHSQLGERLLLSFHPKEALPLQVHTLGLSFDAVAIFLNFTGFCQIYRYFNEGNVNYVGWAGGVIQVALYLDFFYYYWMR